MYPSKDRLIRSGYVFLYLTLTVVGWEHLGSDLVSEQPEIQLFDPSPASYRPLRVNNVVDIDIDGSIDETIWNQAPVIDDFYLANQDPGAMDSTKHRTEARFAYNDRGLFAAFTLYQPPELYAQSLSSRDSGGLNRDFVTIGLDTSGEGRYGYYFTVCLGGTQIDGTLTHPRNFVSTWDGAWWSQTQKVPHGWTAEVFIPWNILNMPNVDSERRIGLYLARNLHAISEHYASPRIHWRSPTFLNVLRPMLVSGINNEYQLSTFPYASYTSDVLQDESKSRAGVDVFYRPSPNFQLTGTIRPDFGTVESDEVVINLTAYETFYPEKRLFFQEDMDVFRISSNQNTPFALLHTRRIGAPPVRPPLQDGYRFDESALRQASDIEIATKLSGNAGRWRYGLLGALEGDTGLLAHSSIDSKMMRINAQGREFWVSRLLYEDASEGNKSIGLLTTHSAHPQISSNTAALDGKLAFRDGQIWLVSQAAISDVEGKERGLGYFTSLRYQPSVNSTYRLTKTRVDKQFDLSQLGFLPRKNQDHLSTQVNYLQYEKGAFRELNFGLEFQDGQNLDGQRTQRNINLSTFLIAQNNHVFWAGVFYHPSVIDDLNSYGNGAFQLDDRLFAGVDYGSDTTKRFSTYQWISTGHSFFEGDWFQAHFSFLYRPLDRWNINMQSFYTIDNGLVLHQGDRRFMVYNTDSVNMTLNTEFFLTARQYLQVGWQWRTLRANSRTLMEKEQDSVNLNAIQPDFELNTGDFAISRMNFQVRYRLEIAPLSDLFLVYTKGTELPDALGRSFGRAFRETFDYPTSEYLVFKVRYRFDAGRVLSGRGREQSTSHYSRNLRNKRYSIIDQWRPSSESTHMSF